MNRGRRRGFCHRFRCIIFICLRFVSQREKHITIHVMAERLLVICTNLVRERAETRRGRLVK